MADSKNIASNSVNIFDKKYAIITHKLFNGCAHDLYRFLKNNNTTYLFFVQHSFSSMPDRKTTFTEFFNNQETTTECLDYTLLPETFVYFKDFLYSFFGILLNRNKFDLIVGCGGLNAFSALLLKWSGRCDKVVFYTIDYVPNRFSNSIMNNVYRRIDKLCVKYCDQTWNLSPRMAEGREKYGNMPLHKYCKQVVIPIGVWVEDLPDIPRRRREERIMIFVGHLLEKQGLQLVLKSVPKIVQSIKNFKLIIIGTGEYEEELKKLAKELDIDTYVEFKGPIWDTEELNLALVNAHLAVAMYGRKKDNFTYYADPTKLKTYLLAGLPILLTDVPYNAKDIEKHECGKIIDYDPDCIAKAAIDLMKDESNLRRYSENARRYAAQFDWNKIFLTALTNLFKP